MHDQSHGLRQSVGQIDPLTITSTNLVIGHRLTGASAGPQLVVAGVCPSADAVFDRILSIPTLPWMRGNLVLLRLDRLEDAAEMLHEIQHIGTIDRTIFLPWPDTEVPSKPLIRQSYHMVLRACTELGMIAGRGVKLQG
ncbi:hypothetical protein [Roseovarius sp.]|uniref:hypothetical protein n=1 Tax=Roseovarius sp. TaxID=1486281 RepID=UPI00257E7A45|nr:hypothetical protein [Roseovarius sp.]|tara:strand:- start:301 stop:717 length:417 start_codon:yes stop_codon:yes gene_type:complete